MTPDARPKAQIDIARWADRQAVAEVACPTCNREIGQTCTRPDGVQHIRTHSARIIAYHDKIGPGEFTKRHSTHVIHRWNYNQSYKSSRK